MKHAQQFELLNAPIHYTTLSRPCVLEDGILKIDPAKESQYVHLFENSKKSNLCSLFIPASGAASRMFKDVIGAQAKDKQKFIALLPQFPFYSILVQQYQSSSENLSFEEFAIAYVGTVMSSLPKGLIVFSHTPHPSTAFEEHILDAIELLQDNARAHFTVPERFIQEINQLFKKITLQKWAQEGIKLDLSLSVQKKETDTISIYQDGTQVLQPDGKPQTRPAGHGALLDNLNQLNEGIIFIHNIDNTSTYANRGLNIHTKKVMAGFLIELKNQIFALIDQLNNNPDYVLNAQDRSLLKNMGLTPSVSHADLLNFLDRPIRVCGVVKNDGQPGGGPFWVENKHQQISLQIIESAEVNMQDPQQENIFKSSTHFNPVNLVCYVKNRKGEKFDLLKFAEPSRSMISWKTHNDKNIKILEYPGLWNGSMEYWNTLFVEIPSETFKPVKTVFDLLKK